MHFRTSLAVASFFFIINAASAQQPTREPVRAPDPAERQMIGEYVRAHLDPLRACYQRRMRALPELRGRLMARFDIRTDGKVEGATADGMSDRQLIDCVTAEIGTWEFGRQPNGRLRVVYPLDFHQG